MTLEWSSFINKRLPLSGNPPDYLKNTINKAWQQHYEELYEPEADGNASLQDTLNEILELFRDSSKILGQIRYVWMGLILASAVEPTLKYYQPNNSIPENTISRIAVWLLETIAEMLNSKSRTSQITLEEANAILTNIDIFSTNKKLGSFQILSEALDVYSSALKTLDSNQSLEALMDILDDCLEGYAIFPGSYGRRELFDWWLLDVVSASWYLLPPSSIYSIDKLANKEKNMAFRHLNRLQKISLAMWSIILNNYPNGQEYNLQNVSSKFGYSLNSMELYVKLGENKFIPNKNLSIYNSI